MHVPADVVRSFNNRVLEHCAKFYDVLEEAKLKRDEKDNKLTRMDVSKPNCTPSNINCGNKEKEN